MILSCNHNVDASSFWQSMPYSSYSLHRGERNARALSGKSAISLAKKSIDNSPGCQNEFLVLLQIGLFLFSESWRESKTSRTTNEQAHQTRFYPSRSPHIFNLRSKMLFFYDSSAHAMRSIFSLVQAKCTKYHPFCARTSVMLFPFSRQSSNIGVSYNRLKIRNAPRLRRVSFTDL